MEQNKITIPIHTLSLPEHEVGFDVARLAAKKLNNLQSRISFANGDSIKGPKIPERDSYDWKILASYHPDSINAEVLSITLVNLPLKTHYYLKYGACAFISLADYIDAEKHIAQDTYLAYFAAKFIIDRYFPSLSSLKHSDACPSINYRRNAPDRRINIGYGEFCPVCLNEIRPIIKKRLVDPDIKDATDLILTKLAQEAHQVGIKESINHLEVRFGPNVESGGANADNPDQQQQEITSSEKDDYFESQIPTQDELNEELANGDVEEPHNGNGSIAIPDDTPVILEDFDERNPVTDGADDSVDSLDHEKYAKLFASLIRDPETTTPLTIALGAAWGRGKSFLADLIQKETGEGVISEEITIHHVDFNAWEYSKAGNIWIHFYAKIVEALGVNKNFLKRYKFIFSLLKLKNKNLLQHLKWLWWLIGYFILIPSLLIYRYFDVLYFVGWYLWWSFVIYVVGAGLLAVTGAVITAIWKLIPPITKHVLPRLALAGFDKKFQSQEEILNNIRHLRDWKRKNCPNERIVVFVDDIDRCEPEEIVGILEALQLFMVKNNIVFILAMDTKVVRRAIGKRYDFMGDDVSADAIGRQYLEKIIQIPFHIPEPNKEMFMNYASKLFNEHVLKGMKRKLEEQIDQANKPSDADKDKEKMETHNQDVADTSNSKKSDKDTQKDPSEIKIATRLFKTASSLFKFRRKKSNEVKRQREEARREAESLRTSEREWEVMGEILAVEEFSMSPRLLKRFRNIYYLSRNLIKKSNIELSDGLIRSYIAWLALSIKYPEETRALHDSFVSNNWALFAPKPNGKDYPWIKSIEEDTSEMVDDYEIKFDKDTILKDAVFSKCNHVKVTEMMNLYIKHYKINNLQLKRVESIYNCFNLMLD